MSRSERISFFRRAIASKQIQIRDCDERIARGESTRYYKAVRSWYIEELQEFREALSECLTDVITTY